MKYFEINPDRNNYTDKKYIDFKFEIKWRPEDIAGYPKANGYIVQSINMDLSEKLVGYPVKHYFEAWKVCDGIVIYENGREPNSSADDTYSYRDTKYMPDIIMESIGKSGRIIYHSEVYWIDANDYKYNEIDNWSYGEVEQAGGFIKSSLYFETMNLAAKFRRDDFVFDYDFTNDKTIRSSLIEIGKKHYDKKVVAENFACSYYPAFQKNRTGLFMEVIKELDRLHNMNSYEALLRRIENKEFEK